jgi:hypothetical protein
VKALVAAAPVPFMVGRRGKPVNVLIPIIRLGG